MCDFMKTNVGTLYEFDREHVIKYSRLISSLRKDIGKRGFLEVRSPVLMTQKIGSSDPVIKTKKTTLGEYFLRTAPDISPFMGELDKFYELGPCFRDEVGVRSSQEFHIMLYVQSDADYNLGQEIFKSLVKNATKEVVGDTILNYQGRRYDTSKWETITFEEAFKEYVGIDKDIYTDPKALEEVCKNKLEIDITQCIFSDSYNHLYHNWLLNQISKKYVEKNLVNATFLINPPYHFELPAVEIDNTRHKEIADSYINGMEIGHIRTVQTDRKELRGWHKRIVNLMTEHGIDDKLDEDYLKIMDKLDKNQIMLGAIGVDRLGMLLLDVPSIDELKPYRFAGTP